MNKIEALVKISHYYGTNPSYVIAGGGNTSYKNSEKLFIKASGISLATLDTTGFVTMSREILGQISEKSYSSDPLFREEEVKLDLKKAIICPEHLRPSVETSLHNLIGYSYVIHTHPTMVNAVMCAKNAQKEVEKRFGSEALYVEYTDPGYTLFRKLEEMISNFEQTFKMPPKLIFLQNHGVFVGSNSVREVKAIYNSIEYRIREGKNLALPEGETEEYHSATSSAVAEHYSGRNLLSTAFKNPLINHFSSDFDHYRKIRSPFTPDIIVYCKSNYLFFAKGMNRKAIVDELIAFEDVHGYFPKIIIEENGGLIIVEEDIKSIQTAFEVFYDMMKISYLSEQFGGPHFMNEDQISFIDKWEVENYRRSVAKA